MKFYRIVVLIDADNTNLDNLEKLMQYISTRGRIVVKRAYGNWSENIKNKNLHYNSLVLKQNIISIVFLEKCNRYSISNRCRRFIT